MGLYINPRTCTKEAFLAAHGKEITRSEMVSFVAFSGPVLPVCLMDNGPFTAAGVCDSSRERDAFVHPDDYRPRRYFLVPRSKLGADAGIPEGLLSLESAE